MSELRRHAEDYLRLRRALGFKLTLHGPLLAQFTDYLDAAGDHHRAGRLLRPAPARRPADRAGTPTQHGARLRPVPAGDRPGDRGPAPPRLCPALPAPDAIPVAGNRSARPDGGCPPAAPSTVRADLPDLLRA